MISIGVPEVAPQNSRVDSQTVVSLPDVTAQTIQLGLKGRQPISLMMADMCDTSEMACVVGEGGDCRDHRRQLGSVAQIKINSVDVISAPHLKVAAIEGDLGAKVLQDVADRIARLEDVTDE